MAQTALNHPIMKQAAQVYYDDESSKEKVFHYFNFGNPTLIMEIFSVTYELEADLIIGMKDQQFYLLDEGYQFCEQTSVNPFKWLLERVPQVQSITEQLLVGGR
ncbi:hypothetical protein [Listeria seeligeri]|uniref:hypothetical protein n=1 Tax=Listeria seeligeri TaxID=1640 RepID=UPI0022EB6CB3|nr:hypothetical protein [Listeria seeligeri]